MHVALIITLKYVQLNYILYYPTYVYFPSTEHPKVISLISYIK